MPTITFGNFLALVLTQLADTLDQTDAKAKATKLHVNTIELEIPAMLHLLVDEAPATTPEQKSHLIVAMPSPREVFPIGRVGRIRMTIAPETTTSLVEETP